MPNGTKQTRPVLGIKPATNGKRSAPRQQRPAKHDVQIPMPADDNLSSIGAAIISPTEVSIREVMSRVEDAFFGLGTEKLPGTIIPTGAKNNAKEAAEYVIADKLVKLAATRLKAASEAAEKSGVFGDKDDYVAGETVMVFADPHFSINVKKGRPGQMLNKDLVAAAAEEYLGKRSQEFMDKCQKERAAPTQIIVSVK